MKFLRITFYWNQTHCQPEISNAAVFLRVEWPSPPEENCLQSYSKVPLHLASEIHIIKREGPFRLQIKFFVCHFKFHQMLPKNEQVEYMLPSKRQRSATTVVKATLANYAMQLVSVLCLKSDIGPTPRHKYGFLEEHGVYSCDSQQL